MNDQSDKNKRVRFNGEVSLGHILTGISMMAALLGMWRNFEIRMTKLEMMQGFQQQTIATIAITVEKLSERSQQQ